MKRLLLVVVLAGEFVAVEVKAQDIGYWSANQMVDVCSYDLSDSTCSAYVRGVFEAHEWELCIPEHATLKQVKKIALKYLDDNPNKLHQLASQSVIDAWQEAFPCE